MDENDFILEKPIQWGLDPLFHVHVKILSSMLSKMVPGNWGISEDQPVYFYKFSTQFRPVRLVQLCGVLVRLDPNKSKTNFVLDDNCGTAVANCYYWNSDTVKVFSGVGKNEPHGHPGHFSLGKFVQCFGRLEWHKGEPTIVAEAIRVAKFARAETNWWTDLVNTHERVYREPFKMQFPGSKFLSLSQQQEQLHQQQDTP